MKVTAFVGSNRKKHTYKATEYLLQKLQSFEEIEYEIVRLNNYNLKICRGCKLCLDKGEELCNLNDDRDILINKMYNSDGVIFATPNYSFQVSGIMKVFLDKLGFIFHRPRFFGKAYTSIVAQGIYGGNKIVKYLNFVGNGLGFNVVKGSCITTLEPMTEKQIRKNNKSIEKQCKRFYSELKQKRFPSPSLLKLMMFRMSRTSIQQMLNKDFCDYNYFSQKGWFKSDYFYPVKLNVIKKLLGNIFDAIAVKMTKP